MLKKVNSPSLITASKEDIRKATKLILPGMGHFDNCMRKIKESDLLLEIENKVKIEKTPVLGICVGLQMLMSESEEGTEKGLSWIAGKTIRFESCRMAGEYKIPNMGWLEIQLKKPSRLMEGLEDSRFYFAHSYHIQAQNSKDVLATTNYGYDFAVGIEKDNILAVQFHPEKSHRFGMRLLKNFSENY